MGLIHPGTQFISQPPDSLRFYCRPTARYPIIAVAMTTGVRQEALAVLAELAALGPEVRLGQLMAHLGCLGEDHFERSLWDIAEDELLTVLRRHRSELFAREQSA